MILIMSCNKPSNFEGGDPSASEQGLLAKDNFNSAGQQTANGNERKLMKEGNIMFESENNKETYSKVTSLCMEFNAYIANENQNNFENRLEQNLTIRIPTDYFDAFVGRLEKLAVKIDNRNVTVSDVTEEFIDIEARLKTKKELESRYRDLLKQAKTVKEVIDVESQLSNVRADIESMEGRLKYLTNRVSYGTLNISFYETIGTDFGFASKFVMALSKGWDNLLTFLIGVVYAWPFVLLLIVAIYFFNKWKKKKSQQLATQTGRNTP